MGLRSPQELNQVAAQPLSVPRVRSIPKTEMSTQFLNQIAQTAGRVIDAQQEQNDKMTAIVRARYREMADAQRIKAEGAVASTQGWNVLNVSKDQTSTLDKNLTALKSSFDSKYEPYLENERLDIINKYNRSTQPYVIGQVKKTTNETYSAIIANEMNDTILDSGNIEGFSDNLERVKGLVREKAFVNFGSDENAEVAPGMKLGEVVKQQTAEAGSKTVANSVIQLAKLGHLQNAEGLFRKYDAEMNPDDRLRAVEAMKSALNAEDGKAAIALADVIQKRANDLVEVEQMASDMATSDKQRSSVMAIIKNRLDIATTAKKKRQEETTSTIYSNLLGGKSLSDVSDLMRTLPVEKQNDIVDTINKNNGKVVPSVTNNSKYNEAVDRIHYDTQNVIDNPNFLAQYIPYLSPSDYSFVQSQYNARKRETADKQEWIRLNSGKIVLDNVTRFNNERNIFNPDAIAKNKRIALEFADSEIAKNPKIDQRELEKKTDAFLYQNSGLPEVKPRGFFKKAWSYTFGDGLDYDVNYNNPQAPDALSPSGQPVTYSKEDMDAFRTEARKQLEAAGRNVDMLAIEKAMRARMQSGKSIKINQGETK